MSEERCETCRFWTEHNESHDEPSGYCRRYPPSIYLHSGPGLPDPNSYAFYMHPSQQPNDWCGEYRPIGSKSDVERIEEAVNSLHASIDAVESAVCRN